MEESGEEVEAPMPASSMEASAYSGRSQVPTKLLTATTGNARHLGAGEISQ